MTDFNYKKYSLENLSNWLHDAMSSAEASPQEIYDTIKKVVQEEYYYYKDRASRTNELLALLNGNIHFNIDPWKSVTDFTNTNISNSYNLCGMGDTSEYCKNSWSSFWEEDAIADDKVIKWQLPVNVDGLTGECYINFPDDLLKVAGLVEGDSVEWVDNENGTYTIRKVK